ncbi:flagellar basal body rod protein FlgG [Afipia sp. P52-10]|jgi:flagellar basal-body rod protein FlgG|uniref:flagellar basal-body rod protein FlgG n=1 Tax=Afipia sp. P52-10 TaxID=1429916 RepID=UPI0003DF369D|nr:flagellar basal-body rod protein FlgG [Afipia sp. P52-10]ETR75836.1 flagellar basal body rod protein FlgG [Afipia sp. P52-10]
MRALHTAATGMMAQELNVQVISNNIANMRTTAYKKQRAEFQDLLYEHQRRVGTQTSDQGNILPVGIEIGSGVRTAGTPRVMSQGNMLPTGKDLDVAIRGEGFFRVLLPDGRTAYTRDGSFEMDQQGRITTSQGYLIQPGITVPQNSTGLTINQQGQVSVTPAGSTTPTQIGQIEMALFINKAGLQSMGDNLYLETPASGAPQVGLGGQPGYGDLLQSNLEQANVEAVSEISDLIAAQRAYEMNAKVISATDQMLQSTTAMLR